MAKYEFIPEKVFKQRRDKEQIPVTYLPDGSYGWVKEKDIFHLTDGVITERIQNSKKKKNKLEQTLDDSYQQIQGGYSYTDFRHDLDLAEDASNGLFEEDEQQVKKRKVSSKQESELEKNCDTAWRFRYLLQKGLIQRKTDASEQDLKAADETLKEMEEYDAKVKVTAEILKRTKLHKVLREIIKKDQLGKQPYNLHERCRGLLTNWADEIEVIKKDKHSKGNGEFHMKNHSRDLSDVSDMMHGAIKVEKA